MPFETVRVRTEDGNEFGPVTWSQMLLWHGEGRVPPTATVIDHFTGEQKPASSFPALVQRPVAAAVPPTPAVAPGYARYDRPGVEVVEYASFWRRFGAAFIDGILLNIGVGIVAFFVGLMMAASGAGEEEAELVGGLLGLTSGWLYAALMESSGTQGTLGKMILGLRVTDLEGERISFARATGRHFGKLLSAAILLIGFLMAAFTERKQTLHDMLAGTLVVHK